MVFVPNWTRIHWHDFIAGIHYNASQGFDRNAWQSIAQLFHSGSNDGEVFDIIWMADKIADDMMDILEFNQFFAKLDRIGTIAIVIRHFDTEKIAETSKGKICQEFASARL